MTGGLFARSTRGPPPQMSGTGSDTSAGGLQHHFAAHVVGVPWVFTTSVRFPTCACPGGGLVRVADESAVDEDRFPAGEPEQVGVREWPGLPGHPRREPLLVGSSHRRRASLTAPRPTGESSGSGVVGPCKMSMSSPVGAGG